MRKLVAFPRVEAFAELQSQLDGFGQEEPSLLQAIENFLELVGNLPGRNGSAGISFAIPITYAKEFLEQSEATTARSRATTGGFPA